MRIALLALFVCLAACAPRQPDPGPAGSGDLGVDCVAVPAATCDEIAAGVEPHVSGARAVAIRIACTAPTGCSAASGTASVDVAYEDGTRSSTGQAWQDAEASGGVIAPEPGGPGLPVRPVCVGIDPATCAERAAEMIDHGAGAPAIRSILVKCTTTCTPTRGEGTVTITYADGSTTNGGFGYEGVVGGG